MLLSILIVLFYTYSLCMLSFSVTHLQEINKMYNQKQAAFNILNI